MNLMDMMQFGSRFSMFKQQHPRVVAFFQENGHELKEGTILELKMRTKEGKELITNMRLTAEDMETLEMIKQKK